MPRQLLFAILALVAAPLLLLGWLSANSMQQQRQLSRDRLRSILQTRLREIDRSLQDVIDGYSIRISKSLSSNRVAAEMLRDLKLSDPAVREGIVITQRGVMVYPPRPTADQPDDIAVYAALTAMVDARPDSDSQDDQGNTATQSTTRRMSRMTRSSPPISIKGQPYWQVWFMDEGSQLILWIDRSDGSKIGVLLERVHWISELTAALPDASIDGNKKTTPGFTALVDESRQIVYRWGDEGDCVDTPFAEINLSAPLSSWKLEYHTPVDLIIPETSIGLYTSLGGIGVILLALGTFVLTSVGRQMRTARNRVSFAGQVSHELRTPLTNIRLYAELAESDLDGLPESESRQKLAQRLGVIDSESRRLGRLVSGVLEMIRDDRRQRGPKIIPGNPDETIELVLQQFGPSFENADVEIDRNLDANTMVSFDPDILEMVLVNLLSNVEKYAAEGNRVEVSSVVDKSLLRVSVRDHGPGIPSRKRRAIFRAFTRLDDSIKAPSGTGIGLTIARSAARRHGGELVLEPTSQGALFVLTLPVTS